MRSIRTPSSNVAFQELGTGQQLPAYQGADGIHITFEPDDLDELRRLAAGARLVLHLEDQAPPPFTLRIAGPPCETCSGDREWIPEGLVGVWYCPACDGDR